MKKEHNGMNKKNETQEQTADLELTAEQTDSLPEEEENEVNPLEEENHKLKEDYLRALAECENIKKRCAAEIEKNNKYAISSFAKDLLVVADNLDRALLAVNSSENGCESLLKGVELTKKELFHVFEKFGITPMDIEGTIFDPNFHQVVQEIEDSSKPAGTVIAELQKGYLINGRLLREAMVIVTKGQN